MKALKILAIALGSYVMIVVVFESLIGFFQPAGEGTLVIVTTDSDGDQHQRVLSSLQSGGQLYVAANHWPRAWYRRALENPEVEVVIEDQRRARRAVTVTGAEHDRVDADNSLPFFFRILTGFPPRYFLRLEPR